MRTKRLFPALLKYWRGKRGLSQLDLALEADVSSRHVSFLESGRAQPSEEMVLRLFAVLGAPLRDQNEALRAAGLPARFEEPAFTSLPPEIDRAIEQMMRQHEPFPLTVLSLDGTILRSNQAAQTLFAEFVAEPALLETVRDLYTLLFDPRLLRPFIVNWEALARSLVSRLHREALVRGDPRLTDRLEHVLAFPGVPVSWRQPDFAADDGPTLTVQHERDGLRANFLVTITTFSSPRQVTLDELRIESCFPLDDATERLCRAVSKRSTRAGRKVS